ncbi:tetratricopeptide repeat protein [Microcystis aeruginosa BLCCF158]|uniref:Tetratricopeptide repeat protein n=1 Tax=Microcystis aeruginosa BLCC-F158 TaxID=2755316 RepID=A0A841V7B5_MICAE|nr:tetratricopeptide repeat protein [Microcystis aeruginosa]MBC1196854.1 tetratricopeptide repeat protein [Microcystis aeruginosa BLCC-F158]
MSSFTPQIRKITRHTGESPSLAMAFKLLKEDRNDEALSVFEDILAADSGSKQAHLGIGNVYVKQKDYNRALIHFQMARKLDPMMAQASIALGNVYCAQNQLEAAVQSFQDALNIEPKALAGYLGVGRALLKQEKYTQAEEQVRKALLLNPQLVQARLLIAQIYQKQGNSEAAIVEIESAIKINPKVWTAYQGLGNIYLKQQEYHLARKNFEEAQQLNPKIPLAAKMGYIEALIEDNALNEAAEILREMPNNNFSGARKQKLLGDIYSRQGLLKEAAESYHAANLLAAEEGDITSELSDLTLLFEEDETKLEEILETYKDKATQRIAQAQLRKNR